MGLSAGTRLGPYEIQDILGVGGMGEVYRARDSRLNRDVAIKVLPGSVSSDPDRIARLRREARAIAALNHPHIAAIYDFAEADGTFGLVLELVEGPTLADRLRGGALPTPEALAIAAQIADAVAAAHDKGIIHRDLKPANIKLTPGGAVKVLDFGLAKAFDDGTMPPDAADATASAPSGLTQAGTALGTPSYMSPEQARGEPLDKRTDIWSFGVVLYEMLVGRRPFAGRTTTDTVAAVLKEEPEWNRVPREAQRLVRRCLEKDPQRRLRDIGDAMTLIDSGAESAPPLWRAGWMRWLWPAAAAVLLIGIAGALMARRPPPSPALPTRFQIPLPDVAGVDAPVLSPDGRHLAYFGEKPDAPGRRRLWLHSLESGQSRQLFQATQPGAGSPFWSPDSRSLAFFADEKLNRIDLGADTLHTVCGVGRNFGGGSWSADGVIVFSRIVLMRVPASGGTPVPLTALDPGRNEIGHYLPAFLPDGRRFLYLRVSPTTNESGVYVGAVDATPDQQQTVRLIETRGGALYAPSPDGGAGHVLFLRDTTLMAQPFHPGRLTLEREPIRVVERVGYSEVPSNRFAYASTSTTGVLAYRHRQTVSGELVWVNRSGREEGRVVPAPLESPQNPRLSPDGTRLAVMAAGNLWVHDLTGKPPVKLTFDGDSDIPLWARDGRHLIYASNAPPTRLMSVSADVGGDTPQPVSPPGHYHPHGWSSDGEMIATVNTYSPTNWDVVKLAPRQAADAQPILKTTSAEGMVGAALSPNGRWLAYTSTVTGTFEVWVQPYPGPGAPIRVSGNGGVDPVWARNGQELYYLEDKKMMAVPVNASATFDFKPPIVLFTSRYLHPLGSPLSYDVAADGRFIMLKRLGEGAAEQPINVVLNWTAALGR